LESVVGNTQLANDLLKSMRKNTVTKSSCDPGGRQVLGDGGEMTHIEQRHFVALFDQVSQ
jgi:hypothetical protein